jgi:DHA1 family multidrug resistance protein-like MFS transporter
MSFIYGLLYLFLTAYALVFHGQYGWNAGISGLAYFGMVVGEIIAFIVVVLDNPRYVRKLKANNDIPVPEWRLPISMVGGVLFAGMPLSYPPIPFTTNSPSFITSLPSYLYPHI